ncbi:hypothetical protein E2C01_083323 [Portunus trituberculatus]|uniref:Uncharacterized protein n=1 Tax=Portunus trituberculatus TaxID=210409 RepID=A0A5B7IS56_PORTR|nr:hypothetical protein [Portunus trituberculatus]
MLCWQCQAFPAASSRGQARSSATSRQQRTSCCLLLPSLNTSTTKNKLKWSCVSSRDGLAASLQRGVVTSCLSTAAYL